ncbi:MAG: beta-galactosidase trimerization domain-containing protein [Verrucomicrobia bacterium]|nr:beta-galactosidase trimerization domain-containing protein [Verrucomicrobiota bacterium]
MQAYDETTFRVSENYLLPDQPVGGVTRAEFERTLAQCGVEARWIGVCDHGGPRFASEHLPLSRRVPGDLTDALRRWAAIVHEAGMNAVTWCPIPWCESAWEARPDWRILDLDGSPKPNNCCINTAFGEALIGVALEFIEKFELDGIWFDGATFTGFPLGPVPGCRCPCCCRKFRDATGHAVPAKVDFEDPVFRVWVQWRFDMFTAFLQRLVDTVRAQHPGAIIAINHYHRYHPNAWHSACPLDRYPCAIVTGSEAMQDIVHSSFSAKMAVAYGRKAEVWTPIARWRMGRDWQFHEPMALLHHAAACVTFGAHPSFGYETDIPDGAMHASAQAFLKPAAGFLRARAAYVERESANPLALHVSQQTETFFFGRHAQASGFGWYWESLLGWDQLLNECGLGVDVVFDSDLRTDSLARYKAVILPLSLALSETQALALAEYARGGGFLLLGPWAGRLNETGLPRSGMGSLEALRAVEEEHAPLPENFVRRTLYQTNAAVKAANQPGFAVNTMIAKQTPKADSEVLMGSRENALVARRTHGRGSIVDLAADWGASFFSVPSSPMRQALVALVEQCAMIPVRVKGPACVRTAVRRGEDADYLILLHNCPATVHHQGYKAGEDYLPIIPRDLIPVCDVSIEIRGAKVAEAARLVERPGPLPVATHDGKTVITLDRLDLHEVVRVKLCRCRPDPAGP